jgi:ferredoxin
MSVVRRILEGPDLPGALGRIAQSAAAPVSAEKRLCLNFRWKRSCTICADLCPGSAIGLEDLKIDPADCIACGACGPACPAGALVFEGRPRTALIEEADDAIERSGIVQFACDRCGGALGKAKKIEGAVTVPCLSMLDEALLLECHAMGGRDVRLLGCSPRCAFKRGRELYLETERLAGELRKALVLRKLPRRARRGKAPAPGAAGGGHDRRAFLAVAGRELLRAAYPPDAPEKRTERWTWLHRLPAGRARLLELAEGPAPGEHCLERFDGMRFCAIEADGARCSMCGACGALCPTGAIGTVELDDSSMLYFNAGWCTGCQLCVRACPERALQAGDRLDPACLAGKGAVLLRLGAARCESCGGRYIPGRTGGECPFCRKSGAGKGPPVEGFSGGNNQNI